MSGGAQPSDAGRPDFEIGLALAGAISAGAYTAGVIDFLIQALQAWEKERQGGGVPTQTVKIRTIAGASAGAITGALGMVALARGLRPAPFTEEEIRTSHREPGTAYQGERSILPSLYEAWVTRPRMVAADAKAMDLLGLDDLSPRTGERGPVEVVSLLNARLLDEIRDRAFDAPASPAPAGGGPPFPFLAATMHVYMTVSNLRGIPFSVHFGNSTYGMQTHGDRLLYQIAGLGTADWAREPWLTADQGLPVLDVATLPQRPGEAASEAWTDYGTTALASGAFPGGLAPRMIAVPLATYAKRQYPLPIDAVIEPRFPASMSGIATYRFLNIDGGVINNNPFDYVQFAVMGHPPSGDPGGDTADRGVIMVAPFPDPPTFLSEGRPTPDLVTVLRALFPTLINQARFRASELSPALDPDDHSRFLIAPHRSLRHGEDERYGIACGLLGGFGGFLDERFRAHDFQLGRRNCQRFLSHVFGLPETNPAIRKSPDSRSFPLGTPPQPPRVWEFMIVPLVGDALPEVALPHWPKMSGGDLRTLLKRIEGRMAAVAPHLIDSQTAKTTVRGLARAGLWFQKDRILTVIQTTVLADLVRRNQIAGWDLPPSLEKTVKSDHPGLRADDVRSILAELVRPSRPSSTAADLAEATHLPLGFVEDVLTALAQAPEGKPFRVVRTEKAGLLDHTLEMHLPRGLRAWPVVGPLARRLVPAFYPYD